MSERRTCSACGRISHVDDVYIGFYKYPDGTYTKRCRPCHIKHLMDKYGYHKCDIQTFNCRSKIDLVKCIQVNKSRAELLEILDVQADKMPGWSKVITTVPLSEAHGIYLSNLNEENKNGSRWREADGELYPRSDMWRMARNIMVDFGGMDWPAHPHPELIAWDDGKMNQRKGRAKRHPGHDVVCNDPVARLALPGFNNSDYRRKF